MVIVAGRPSAPSACSPNAVAYLRPSWKTWPNSMPRPIDNSSSAARAAVSVANLDGPDLTVGYEVAPAHDERGVPVKFVGAGDPGAAVGDERVDDITHAGVGEDLRADVALHQSRLAGQVGGVGLRDLDRLELAGDPFQVDLAIARHAHDEQVPGVRARAGGS